MHGGVTGGGGGVVVVGLWFVVCALSCLSGVLSATSGVQQQQQGQLWPACRGLHRVEVDWWVMLKHPRGYQYSYVDSTGVSSSAVSSCDKGLCWQHGLSMLNPNPVSHTLEVLEPTAAAVTAATAATAAGVPLAHIVYNDADPGGTEHFEYAHAKGVVAFTHATGTAGSSNGSSSNVSAAGFWLVHSAPRFPGLPGTAGWANLQRPQSVFGQHFSCFSLAGSHSIAALADVLLAAGPYVYSSSLPAALAAALPAWQQLVAGAFVTTPVAISTSLVSTERQLLRVFAKSSALNASLTDAIVGPGLGVNMLWETWRRGHDALPSRCPHAAAAVGGSGTSNGSSSSSSSSLNVDEVAFVGTWYRWGWGQDHSKWGVSSSDSSSSDSNSDAPAQLYICLGDMNRAGWQAHRGGSFVCMQHRGLWQALHGLVAAAEPCVWVT